MTQPATNPPPLEFSAPAKITAKPGRPPRLEVLGYAGGIMSPDGHGPTVVDLDGLELPPTVPALEDHKNALDAVVGQLTPTVRQGKLYASGTLSTATESGQRVLRLHEDGVQLQASIGAEPTGTYEPIRPGATFQVNGRTLTAGPAGVKLFRKTRLREITICANGADHETAVSIMAKQPGNRMQSDAPTDNQPLDRDELQRGMARIDSTLGVIGETRAAELRASFVSGELAYADLDDMIFEDLKAKAELGAIRASRPKPPSSYAGNPGPQASDAEKLEASLATKFLGEAAAERLYGSQTLQASVSLNGLTAVDATNRLNGHEGLSSHNEKISAAFSPPIRASSGFTTISLPIALGNVANKALAQMYRDSPATWRAFCDIKRASNFHEQTGVRPSAFGELERVGPQGEIKHDTLTTESLYKWRLDTYSKQIRVSRQHLINDDLSFIEEVVKSMGPAGMRKLSDLVYTTLKGAGSGHFSTDKGNLNTSNPLSVQGFAKALQEMRSQVDERGHYIDAQPATLLVPPALEQQAREILQSEFTERVAADTDEVRGTGNPFRQAVSLEVEPRLETDPTTWYLFAAPAMNPLTVGFLDGKQAPTLEFFGLDSDPNTLGVSWRVYHDFGVALGDFRAAQKNVA